MGEGGGGEGVGDMGSPRNIAEACQVMVAVLRVLSPNYPCELWLNVKESNDMCEALEVGKEVSLREDDVKYLRALSESYNNATSANVKLQILSIMADITTLQEIRKYIPGLTKYMFCQARQHILVSGRGAPVIAKQARDGESILTSWITSWILLPVPTSCRFYHSVNGF